MSRERGLAGNTVHGSFEVVKAFANWTSREGYHVDSALLRARTPKVAQSEMETYSQAQLEALMRAIPPGWPLLAVQILFGTGMRVGELCNLRVDDFEDDGQAAFLKIQRGKGAKFRRVPVRQRLRREVVRYLNRLRPDSPAVWLLLRRDGRGIEVATVTDLFQRMRR